MSSFYVRSEYSNTMVNNSISGYYVGFFYKPSPHCSEVVTQWTD